MTWQYRQSTGELSYAGKLVGAGYSGHGPGVNNPDLQADPDIGPIPAGPWNIGPAEFNAKLGPVAMLLSPVGWDALGRSGFFMHGDNAAMNETGSEGCIVMSRAIREQVSASPDRGLVVIP